MKKLQSFLILLIFGLIVASCSTTQDLPKKALFPFEYQNNDYQIISITSPSGEGINILVKFENDTTVFRTLDQDQDGIIDLIQYGSVTLDEANQIYSMGIREAQNAGKIKERERERLFKYSENQHHFTVQTYGLYSDQYYNRFIIINIKENLEETYLDLNANGFLDQSQSSHRDIEEVQLYYTKVLQQGLKQNRIRLINNKYVVKIISNPKPS
ncbi:MAG: hypothetical protein WD022_02905 [Balneolaceae bacterium]